LIAKTYGVRRIVSRDEQIWPFCKLCFGFPFVLLLTVMWIENICIARKKAAQKKVEDDKLKEKKDK
jgi:hypothetical protein